MNLEHLKNECPQMPDNIKAMIEKEVEKQINSPIEIKRRHFSWQRRLAIALIAVMTLSATVYAGVKLYQWNVEKEGNYGLRAGVVVDGNDVPEEIPVLSVKAGWLPKGMVQDFDGAPKYSYESTPFEGGFSISVIAMDKSLSKNRLPVSDKDVTVSEIIKVNDNDGIYIGKSGGGFNKKVYVAYPDQWQIVEIFAGEDMTKDETLKFAQNLKVVPTEKTEPLSEMITWSQLTDLEFKDSGMKLSATNKEMKNLHKVGDKFKVDTLAFVDGKFKQVDGLQAQVADVKIGDNLSALNDKYVDAELKAAADSNGNLVDNNISYIKSGDGINTIDKKIQSVQVPQRIVKVTVKYTNTGKNELKDVCFFGSFVGLTKNGGGYGFYDRALTDADENTDAISADSIGGFGAMDYYDSHGGDDNKNYISSIKPGETAIVNIAKVVNEDELDKLFLSLDSQGAECEFTEHALEIGYVDIRQ